MKWSESRISTRKKIEVKQVFFLHPLTNSNFLSHAFDTCNVYKRIIRDACQSTILCEHVGLVAFSNSHGFVMKRISLWMQTDFKCVLSVESVAPKSAIFNFVCTSHASWFGCIFISLHAVLIISKHFVRVLFCLSCFEPRKKKRGASGRWRLFRRARWMNFTARATQNMLIGATRT